MFNPATKSWVVVSKIFYFHPYLPIWLIFFKRVETTNQKVVFLTLASYLAYRHWRVLAFFLKDLLKSWKLFQQVPEILYHDMKSTANSQVLPLIDEAATWQRKHRPILSKCWFHCWGNMCLFLPSPNFWFIKEMGACFFCWNSSGVG